MRTPESTLLLLAHDQHLVVSRAQLLAEGLTDTDIARFRRRGLIQATAAQGVYGLGEPPRGRDARLMAATLAIKGSAVHRRSAAQLLGFPPSAKFAGSPPEIVAPHNGPSRSPFVELHRSRHLPSIDITTRGPFRVTAPARTFCDLASTTGYARMKHLGQQLLVRRQLSHDDLFGCASAWVRRGRTGSRILRLVLAAIDDGQPLPDSDLELLFIERVLIPFGLPLDRQVRPPWYDGWRGTVDFGSLAEKVIVETDGRAWHQIAQDFERDRERDRLAQRHGFVCLRFAATEIRRDPRAAADEIGFHLRQRRAA